MADLNPLQFPLIVSLASSYPVRHSVPPGIKESRMVTELSFHVSSSGLYTIKVVKWKHCWFHTRWFCYFDSVSKESSSLKYLQAHPSVPLPLRSSYVLTASHAANGTSLNSFFKRDPKNKYFRYNNNNNFKWRMSVYFLLYCRQCKRIKLSRVYK